MRSKVLLAICSLATALSSAAWAQRAAVPQVRPSRFGAIRGQVSDSRGVAQANVPVTVVRQDGLFISKIRTARNGRFDLSHLSPGLYAVEVSLPYFLPFSKAPVAIRAGAEVLMNINLRALADSVEIGLPSNPAQAREDWKWTLRTASPARPILRFQQETEHSQRAGITAPHERPLRGSVLVSAGNESRGFGTDPGVRTIFNVTYDWSSANVFDMAGSAGFERGAPAASFRAAWNRRSESGSTSSLSATVRQLFLPSAYLQQLAIPYLAKDRRIQSFSGRYENDMQLTSRATLRYGADFDSVALKNLVRQWAPFAQLTYASGNDTRWKLSYTAETPRAAPAGFPGSGPAGDLLPIPQISTDVANGYRPALESGRHIEAGWERSVGGRYRVEAATFYDSFSDVAISLATSDGNFQTGLLSDPFSNNHFLDGGNYSSLGARAGFSTRLPKNSQVIVTYSFAGGLRAIASELNAENASALRELLRSQPGSSVLVKFLSTLPWSRTRVVTSYNWLQIGRASCRERV